MDFTKPFGYFATAAVAMMKPYRTTTEAIPNLSVLYGLVTSLSKIFIDDGSAIRFAIAGGAIESALVGRRIKDVDVFVENYALAVKAMKGAGYESTFTNEKVTNFRVGRLTVQIIDHPYRDAGSLIDDFDYTVACAAIPGYSGATTTPHYDLIHHPRFFQDVAASRLVVHKITFPLSTLERMARYSRKGYRACPIGLLELAKAINALQVDWNDPDENSLSFYPDGTPRFNGVD